MLELFNEAFSPANIIITFLLIFILFYWLTVILGMFDAEFLDIDLDLDVDADVDADLDVDTDVDGNVSGGGWALGILRFLNVGTMPFTIYLSILFISMWVISMLTHHYLGDFDSWFSALVFFLPILFVGLIVTKIITQPLVGVFKNIKSTVAEDMDFHGEVAEIILSTTPNKMGQVELNVNGDHFTLNVKAEKGYLFSRGDKVVITEHLKKEQCYLVEPFE